MRFLLTLTTLLVVATVASSAPGYGIASSLRNGYRNSRDFAVGVYRGTGDMVRAYKDMRDANHLNSDLYFHARGNRDAARRGAGGRLAASVISNGREVVDILRGGSFADSARDQAANRLGRNGGDISVYRPRHLPPQY